MDPPKKPTRLFQMKTRLSTMPRIDHMNLFIAHPHPHPRG